MLFFFSPPHSPCAVRFFFSCALPLRTAETEREVDLTLFAFSTQQCNSRVAEIAIEFQARAPSNRATWLITALESHIHPSWVASAFSYNVTSNQKCLERGVGFDDDSISWFELSHAAAAKKVSLRMKYWLEKGGECRSFHVLSVQCIHDAVVTGVKAEGVGSKGDCLATLSGARCSVNRRSVTLSVHQDDCIVQCSEN